MSLSKPVSPVAIVHGLPFTPEMVDMLPVLKEMLSIHNAATELKCDGIPMEKLFIAFAYASTKVLPCNIDSDVAKEALDFWGVYTSKLKTSSQLRREIAAFQSNRFVLLQISPKIDEWAPIEKIYIPVGAKLQSPIPSVLPQPKPLNFNGLASLALAPYAESERLTSVAEVIEYFQEMTCDCSAGMCRDMQLFYAAVKELTKLNLGVEIRGLSFGCSDGDEDDEDGDEIPGGWVIEKIYRRTVD